MRDRREEERNAIFLLLPRRDDSQANMRTEKISGRETGEKVEGGNPNPVPVFISFMAPDFLGISYYSFL